jgi:hypothetical protein
MGGMFSAIQKKKKKTKGRYLFLNKPRIRKSKVAVNSYLSFSSDDALDEVHPPPHRRAFPIPSVPFLPATQIEIAATAGSSYVIGKPQARVEVKFGSRADDLCKSKGCQTRQRLAKTFLHPHLRRYIVKFLSMLKDRQDLQYTGAGMLTLRFAFA